MKKTLSLLMLLYLCGIMAQTKSRVENPPIQNMDLVLFSFGVLESFSIGSLTDSGELIIKFPNDLNFISDEAKENSWSDASFTLFSKCDNSYDILSADENVKAVSGGYISLSTKDNSYSGLLFMVTNKDLVPWLEDSYSNDAALGSYFELVYMASDFKYQGNCTSTTSNIENDNIETLYSYDLELKAGFNFIEYKIESVKEYKVPSMYEEGVFDNLVKPSTVKVTSTQAMPPKTLWIAKYY